MRQETGEAIARARLARPFVDADDLQHRCGLRAGDLDRLAEAGALASLGLTRRAALWQAALAVRPTTPLFAAGAKDETSAVLATSSPLPEMTPWEETRADFTTAGMTTGRHPVAYFRAALRARGVLAAVDLAAVPDGRRVRTAGSVIVRQRPGTAKGMLFFTLEDETGMSQAIVGPKLLQENRQTLVGASGLVVEGILEQRDGTVSIKAERFWPLTALAAAASHDFR